MNKYINIAVVLIYKITTFSNEIFLNYGSIYWFIARLNFVCLNDAMTTWELIDFSIAFRCFGFKPNHSFSKKLICHNKTFGNIHDTDFSIIWSMVYWNIGKRNALTGRHTKSI